MIFIPLLILFLAFQGLGNCAASPQDDSAQSPAMPANSATMDDDKSPAQLASGKIDEHFLVSAPLLRERRHIGSIAAFRGLPGQFNKFSGGPGEWTSAIERMGDDDVSKDKRYPEATVPLASPHRPNPVMMRNTPPSAAAVVSRPAGTETRKIFLPPHSEVRARAVNRLLRLLADAKTSPKTYNSVSKKFLGALARGNALPGAPFPSRFQPSSSLVQYKGSTAIPLPGKRNAEMASAYSLTPQYYPWSTDDNAAGEDEDDYYSDAEGLDLETAGEESIMPEDYEENDKWQGPLKRNIASLAKSAKVGFLRHSRDYNRVPQLPF